MAKTTCCKAKQKPCCAALHCAVSSRAGVTMSPPSRARQIPAADGDQFPFWTGECGPVEAVRAGCYEPCPRCGPESCGNGSACARPAYGSFTAGAPLNIPAGGGVPLAAAGDGTGLSALADSVLIGESGSYFASYTVNVPENIFLSTNLALQLDGTPLPGGTQADASGAAAAVFSGQAVFSAEAGSTLSLVTSNAVSIPQGAAEGPVFTLFLMKIAN